MKQIPNIEEYRREFPPEEINALPLKSWQGPVHVVRSKKQVKAAAKALVQDAVLGFDTESRPVFKKGKTNPLSLLQLATADEVFLFQFPGATLEPELIEVLADPDVPKAGVAVRDDVLELRKITDFEPGGFTDLGDVAAEYGLKTRGLRNLAANLLGFRISKGQRCTNWARTDLTPKQIIYAATDAWIGRELFYKMRELGMV